MASLHGIHCSKKYSAYLANCRCPDKKTSSLLHLRRDISGTGDLTVARTARSPAHLCWNCRINVRPSSDCRSCSFDRRTISASHRHDDDSVRTEASILKPSWCLMLRMLPWMSKGKKHRRQRAKPMMAASGSYACRACRSPLMPFLWCARYVCTLSGALLAGGRSASAGSTCSARASR